MTVELSLPEVAALEEQGKATQFTCPECGGTLYEDPGPGRGDFRCRVGHTYSPETLLSDHSESVEAAMWTAIRALEENAALHSRMYDRALKRDSQTIAEKYWRKERELLRLADVIRDALLAGSNPGAHN